MWLTIELNILTEVLLNFELNWGSASFCSPGCLCCGSAPILLQYLQGGRCPLLPRFSGGRSFTLVSTSQSEEEEEGEEAPGWLNLSVVSHPWCSEHRGEQQQRLLPKWQRWEVEMWSSFTILSWWFAEMVKTRWAWRWNTQVFHIRTRTLESSGITK